LISNTHEFGTPIANALPEYNTMWKERGDGS